MRFPVHNAARLGRTLAASALLIWCACIDEEPLRPETNSAKSTPPTTNAVLNTAFVLINFADEPLGCSVAELREDIITGPTSVNAMIQESSKGAASLADNFFGPFTISHAVGSACNESSWADEADAALVGLGVQPESFTYIVYIAPREPACLPVRGRAGCDSRRVFVYERCDEIGATIAHELGHALCLEHANTSFPGQPNLEYADLSCSMGKTWDVDHFVPLRQYNAPHLYRKNWIAADRVIVESSVPELRTYSLAATEENPGSLAPGIPQIVLIANPCATASNLYFSTRRPLGAFDGQSFMSPYWDKLNIHTMSPGGTTYLEAILGTGETYDDVHRGIHISVTSCGGGGLVVFQVSRVPDTTPPSSPPANVLSTTCSSITLTWEVAPYLDNGGSCVAKSQVRRSDIATWTDVFGMGTPTYTDHSAVWGVNYTYLVRLVDGAGNAGTPTSKSATANPADAVPPSMPTGVQGVPIYDTVRLTWNAATDNCSGIARYEVKRLDLGDIWPTTALIYLDETTSEYTMYTYQLRSVDRAGNVSAWKSYKVTTGGPPPPPEMP